ncbi:hypothetical protein MNBD_GAMMA07-586 [hydrothermal vent metagenome]|uniref:Organic solvent tolerance-like N-terminal domain-containing protein n=1 Tax=hydrothermal vent metagenome TaxID=652676 RepID=A0A3B0XIW2_9ZZZZ
MKQLIKAILFFSLFICINAIAKTTDKSAPLHIEADQLEMRERDNVSIYKGNVKITRGSMIINGDTIIITNKNGKLYRIEANGKPAVFFQLNDLDEAISAEGYYIDYNEKNSMLELKEKAKLLKNKNYFSSEHIIYNTLKDIVRAGKHKASPETETPRVKITIYPESDKTTNRQ